MCCVKSHSPRDWPGQKQSCNLRGLWELSIQSRQAISIIRLAKHQSIQCIGWTISDDQKRNHQDLTQKIFTNSNRKNNVDEISLDIKRFHWRNRLRSSHLEVKTPEKFQCHWSQPVSTSMHCSFSLRSRDALTEAITTVDAIRCDPLQNNRSS